MTRSIPRRAPRLACAVIIAAAAPTNDPLLLAAEIARDRANVVVVGDVKLDVPRAPMFSKELSLRVSRSYGPGRYDPEYEERGLDYPVGYVRWSEQRNMEALLDLQANGLLQLEDLIEEVLPVEEAERAYGRLMGEPAQRPRGALVLSYPEGVREGDSATRAAQSAAEPITAGPSGAVRLGLLGPGNFATSTIIPAFERGGATLAVVAGGSGPRAEAASRNGDFARTAESESALMADDGVDAVAICTRHATHARLVAEALRAGRHVFCEKPLAMNEEELEDVLAAKADSGRVLAVGFNRRWAPLMRDLHGWVGAGLAPLTASFRVSAGQIEADHWIHDLEQGGGRAIGEVCHFVDTLVYVAGAPVAEVHAAGHGANLPLQARDNLAITLTFANGSVGTIVYVAQGASAVDKERLEVFSGSRTAVLHDFRSLDLYDGRKHEERGGRVQDKGHNQEIQAFLDGVRAGADPVPVHQLENVTRATFGIIESLRTGAPVPLTAS